MSNREANAQINDAGEPNGTIGEREWMDESKKEEI
jgi:hypothetical protein